MMEPSKTRPQGITILAILAAIGGVLGVLGSLAILAVGGLVGAVGAAAGVTAGLFGGLLFIYGLLLLAISVGDIAIAYGFWMLKPWGYQLGIYVSAASIALSILGVLLWGQGIVGAIISVAISGAIIYYLMTPPVKAAFGQK